MEGSAVPPSLAVVIPAYNENKTIRDIVVRTLAQCAWVVVVDDASNDGTAESLADLPVVLLRNDVNQGKGFSLFRGVQAALADGAQGIVTLDADGQHRPEDIRILWEASRGGSDVVVIGSRLLNRDNTPALRLFGNRCANFWLSWLVGQRLQDSQSGFRLYPAALFRGPQIPHDKCRGFVFESEILVEAIRLGYQLVSVPIPAIYPEQSRPSHYIPGIDTWRIARMIAAKLLRGSLCPANFYRAFIAPRLRSRAGSGPNVSDVVQSSPPDLGSLLDQHESRSLNTRNR